MSSISLIPSVTFINNRLPLKATDIIQPCTTFSFNWYTYLQTHMEKLFLKIEPIKILLCHLFLITVIVL